MMIETLEIDRETKQLLKALQVKTGKPQDVVLKESLRIASHRGLGERVKSPEERRRAINEIQEHVAKLIVLDDRSPDTIIGYDENGLP